MSVQLQMFSQETCEDSRNATSSQASADGATHCNLRDGRNSNPSGQQASRASHSAAQASKKAQAMIATSGPSFIGLSESSNLSESLASKLRRRLDSIGSMEYRQTWSRKATVSGRLYWAHTASAHRKSGIGFFGWPTPKGIEAVSLLGTRKGSFKPGMTLTDAAILTGWPTPLAITIDDNPEERAKRSKKHGFGVAETLIMAARSALGQSSKRLNAAGSSGELNPDLSRWLMGFPIEWQFSAVTAMQSSRKSRLSSSARISTP